MDWRAYDGKYRYACVKSEYPCRHLSFVEIWKNRSEVVEDYWKAITALFVRGKHPLME